MYICVCTCMYIYSPNKNKLFTVRELYKPQSLGHISAYTKVLVQNPKCKDQARFDRKIAQFNKCFLK